MLLGHLAGRGDHCSARPTVPRAEPAGPAALGLEGDEATGAGIVRRALSDPARLIAANAGYEGGVVIERIRSEAGNTGFNAATGEWGDLVKAGIIDPAKVTRSALQNAASVAAMALTTECLITDVPEGEPPIPMPNRAAQASSFSAMRR